MIPPPLMWVGGPATFVGTPLGMRPSTQVGNDPTVKALSEAHHLKRGTAKRAIGVVQGLADLEMIVVFGHD